MIKNEQSSRRIAYASVPCGNKFTTDRDDIVHRSRVNNGMDGLTGVLWSSPDLYVHVLEGPPDAVATTLDRIRADARHKDVDMLSDSVEQDRLFGSWTMAGLPGSSPPVLDRLIKLLRGLGSQRANEVAETIMTNMLAA